MKSLNRVTSKKKVLSLILLIIFLCMGIGYAILSENMKINTIAKIGANIWDVHFENISVREGSIEGNPVIGSDKTSLSLNFTFGEPGEFYEFYVDVVNSGSIDARVESFVKTILTETQSHYLTFHVTYADGVEIQRGDTLKVGEKEQLKVLIQFNRIIKAEELPSKGETINLTCQINYVQEDGNGVLRKRKVLSRVLSSVAESDVNLNLGTEKNGVGVYKLTKIEKDGEPIYYYRGAVENNNVIFANFCWKIIRTTNTGGVKLIYNGIPNNGICNNTGDATEIGKSVFNTGQGDSKYVGYMYDNNTKDSTIKGVVDEWFRNNLLNYLDYLEDTPFYNERDGAVGDNYPFNFAPSIRIWGLVFSEEADAVKRATIKLGATNKEDIFTVSSEIGNGALTYPVGLITSDELLMAGSLLASSSHYYTLSPSRYSHGGIPVMIAALAVKDGYGFGIGDGYWDGTLGGVRPVLSLKKGSLYSSGDGSVQSPYVISN